MSEQQLYASLGFLGDAQLPRVRVTRASTRDKIHVNIGMFSLLVDPVTAHALRAQLDAVLNEPN